MATALKLSDFMLEGVVVLRTCPLSRLFSLDLSRACAETDAYWLPVAASGLLVDGWPTGSSQTGWGAIDVDLPEANSWPGTPPSFQEAPATALPA